MRNYLELNEFKPLQTIYNPDGPRWETGARKFQLGSHSIEWINEEQGPRSRSMIKVDGEVLKLGDLKSLNIPEQGTERFGMEMVNQWDEIKHYDTGHQEFIAISMRGSVCSGLSCSVGVQLWYDLRTRRSTLFGTFRTDPEPKLFNWPGGGNPYILGSTYSGDSRGAIGPLEWRYEFYRILPDGRFEIQNDKTGKPYFLKHTSYPDLVQVNGKWVRKPGLPFDTLEQNWLEDVLRN